MVSDVVMIEALEQVMAFKIVSTILWILFLIFVISIITSQSRTKKAREEFADLYIVGTIRKFAKEDGIDLNEELKEIRRFEKIEKASMRTIDRQIEVELNEKISDKNQKRIDAINESVKEEIDYKDLTKK